MNVLLVCYDISRDGGLERVAVNLYRELQKCMNVHLVSLFCEHSDNPFFLKIQHDIDVLHHQKGVFIRDFPFVMFKLRNLQRKYQSSIVLSVGLNCGLYACLLKCCRGVKTIVCEHNILQNSVYNSWRTVLKRKAVILMCDKLITLTEWDQEEYAKAYPKFRRKFQFIYNWIDIDPRSENSEYDIQSKKIVTVCRIAPIKGIERSIEAFQKISARYPGWTWEVYGSGDETYLRELRELVEQRQVENFFFKGYCSDVSAVYPGAALYACTSFFEGLPLSLLEAKSWRVPIVSFDCKTGPGEIIEDGVNGFLVPDGDVGAFAERLERLMGDAGLRKRLSDMSYSNMDKFRKSEIVKQWIHLFETL